MKVMLVSLNYFPELTGIGKYNGDMSPSLVSRDVNVSAIVAPPYYPEWKVHSGYSSWLYRKEEINDVSIIRCPLYVPKNLTTVKRIIHLVSFSISSSVALFSKFFYKPEIIILVQPTLFCAPAVLLFAKIVGAKTVMHIQDYEVDAMFGLGMVQEGKIAKIVKSIEQWLYKKFDAISTISYSMIDNAILKGAKKENIIYFPNWSDVNFVTPDTCGNQLKKEWGFTPSDKIVLYAGNIGKKQGLEIVLDAAKSFLDNPHIHFVIVGSGGHVKYLKELAKSMMLTNLTFKPLLAWERVPEMLALADIHLVIQKKGVADAVLPSKLTNILSAGGYALVTAEADTELGKLNLRYPGILTCIEPEDVDILIGTLKSMLSYEQDSYNKVAREFAEKFLDKEKVIDNFVTDLGRVIA